MDSQNFVTLIACGLLLVWSAQGFELGRFIEVRGSTLRGHDSERITDVAVEKCATECLTKPTCKSFEYKAQERKCDLSTASAEAVPLTKNEHGWDYYQLFPRPESIDGRERVEELTVVTANLTAVNSKLTAQIQAIASLNKILNTEKSKAVTKETALRKTLRQLESENKGQRTTILDLGTMIKDLQGELQNLTNTIVDLRSQLQEVSKENEDLENVKMKLHEDISQKETTILDLKMQKNDLKRFLDNCQTVKSEMSKEVSILEQQVSSLKRQINAAFRPSDCADVYKKYGKRTSGVYRIYLINRPSFEVYCDMSNGGGWTIIQRRLNMRENFRRNWSEYKGGFGAVTGEYWLGNDIIHALTLTSSRLRINLQKGTGSRKTTSFAQYSKFRVSGESSKYTLTVSGYSGTSGDNLTPLSGHSFSTKDRDNSGNRCSNILSGGWWMKSHKSGWWLWVRGTCDMTCNLNGVGNSLLWNKWTSKTAMTATMMAIRPTNF